jgi:hypothetical protein
LQQICSHYDCVLASAINVRLPDTVALLAVVKGSCGWNPNMTFFETGVPSAAVTDLTPTPKEGPHQLASPLVILVPHPTSFAVITYSGIDASWTFQNTQLLSIARVGDKKLFTYQEQDCQALVGHITLHLSPFNTHSTQLHKKNQNISISSPICPIELQRTPSCCNCVPY